MASIDLREAYLQVPVHPESRPFLRFVANGQVYQFTALCFGLFTAPQVFTRVMAPVSSILHSWGIRMCRYLGDWLVQSSSRESLLQDLQVVLSLCWELCIVINPEKSNLKPSQVVQYLGVIVNAQTFVASPSPERVSRLQSTAGVFLSSAAPPASLWLSLLGMLSSMAHLVPGGRLHMQSLQLCLHQSWDRVDQSTRIPWSPDCLRDLRWWLSQGVSLRQVSPDLDFWSDTSAVGWGAHMGHHTASGLWSEERTSCGTARPPPLPVISGGEDDCRVLRQHHGGGLPSQGGGHEVSLPELYRAGDPPLVRVARHPSGSAIYSGGSQCPGRHSVSPSPAASYRVVPQSGGVSIFASSVASPDRLICHLRESPLFDLFLSLPGPSSGGHGRVSPVLGRSPGICFSSVVHHSQSSCQTPGVSRDEAHLSGSILAPRGPGFRTSSSCRWNLQWFCRSAPTSCSCQGLHRLQLHAWRLAGASPGLPASLRQ